MRDLSSTIPKDWQRKAAAMQRRVNAGWFWTFFASWMVAGMALGALLVWLLRLQDVDPTPGWVACLGCLITAALGAQMKMPDKMTSMEKALSRLDVAWGLHHRLVSAWQGVGDWPECPKRSLPVKMKPGWFLGPFFLGTSFLAAAMLLPIPVPPVIPVYARAEPPEWGALDTLAEQMQEEEWVQEEAVRSLREELEQLRAKPAEEWYDPATLEATDRLRARMAMDAEKLLKGMENTSALLQLAEEAGSRVTPVQQQAMQQYLQQMLEQMGGGDLKLDAELLQQLSEIDLSRLEQMDPQQLQQLEEMLAGNCDGLEEACLAAGLIYAEGDEPGSGGISRGGGPSELSLLDFETTVEPVVPMGLEAGEIENARIGDLLDVREAEHVDEREAVPSTAGGLQTEGGSGEIVWEQDLLPAEQNLLKDFFK